MRKLFFILMAVLAGVLPLSAQQFEEITLNDQGQATVNIDLPGVNCYSFLATKAGVLEFNVGWSSTMIYQCDASASEGSKVVLSKSMAPDESGNVYSITVEEGVQYYFCTSYMVEPIEMTVAYGSGDNSIRLSANYEDGATFAMTGSNLELTIDRPVTISRTLVLYGEDGQEDVPVSCINYIFVTQYYYTIDLRSLVDYLMDGGKISVGDRFTIRLEGIADAANPSVLYGTDGTYSISFILDEMPATLLSINPADGSNIYTYYPEGGEDGFITFTFSEALDEDTESVNVTLSWGDQEAGSYEAYHPNFTIEGSVVAVDIRGIRIPEEVEGGRGSGGATRVSLSVSGLKTVDGRAVSPNYENAGTSAILAFYGVVKQEITFYYDFDPLDGNASLADYKEIMIWLSEPILYSGVQLQWFNARGQQQARNWTAEQIPFEWDGDEEGYVAYVPLSGISYNIQPVTVTVLDAYLMNGDAVTITGTFNTYPNSIGHLGVAPDEVVKVYGIDGRFVKEGIGEAAFEGLERGIYVAKGRKVLVR